MDINSILSARFNASISNSRVATGLEYGETKVAGEITTTESNNDVLNISEEGKMLALSSGMKDRSTNIISAMEKDLELAKKMAKSAAYSPDYLYIDTQPGELQRKSMKEFFYADGTSILDRDYADQFNKQSLEVRQQRIDLYEIEKSHGTSDVDIYKLIQDFNNSLPVEYKSKAGML